MMRQQISGVVTSRQVSQDGGNLVQDVDAGAHVSGQVLKQSGDRVLL